MGASHSVLDLTRNVRLRTSAPTKSTLWYSFSHQVSPLVHADGIATDLFVGMDVNARSLDVSVPFDIITEMSFGFPFRSHSYTAVRGVQDNKGYQSVRVLKGSGWRIKDIAVPLSLKPVGLVANAAIMFVVLYITNYCARYVLRRYRASRRQCVSCSYSLAGLPVSITKCPECGSDISGVCGRF